MRNKRRLAAALVAAAVLATACGSDESTSSSSDSTTSSPASTAGPSSTAVVRTTTPTTTTTTTTTKPTTTTTTTAPVTTAVPGSGPAVPVPAPLEPPADPLAWEPRELGGGAGTPCCGEPWRGVGVSPPFGSPDQPLADGFYTYNIDSWNQISGEPALEAVVEIWRFEACARDEAWGGDLPLGCLLDHDWPGGAVEVDRSYALVRPLRIDEDVLVAYTGGLGCETGPSVAQFVTTGAGYAVMIERLRTDYEEWIGRFLRDPSLGVDENGILERLRTDPASPFDVDPCQDNRVGISLWTSPEGVPVLLQGLGSPLDPWELTFPVTMQVTDGQVVLYTGGYYRS